MHSYAGLADGLTLTHGLCDRFWPDLHPQPDGPDFELRIGARSRLLSELLGVPPRNDDR